MLSHSRFFLILPAFVSLLLIGEVAALGQAKGSDKTDSEILAVVNGNRVISTKEVDELLGSQIRELQEKMYFIRNTALNNLIIRLIIEEEATSKGVTPDELKRQLTSGKVEIAQAKVDEVYDENSALFTNMSQDEAKERIRMDLESHEKMAKYRAAIEALRRKTRVEMYLSPPPPVAANIGTDGPVKGAPDAPVTIVEFSDFQCPYCKQVTPILNQVMGFYGNRVRLIFKHLPLTSIHPQALEAAQAGVCAARQGKFWEYHDRLFDSSPNLSPVMLEKIASEIGLNVGGFSSCLSSEESRSAIQRDLQVAKKLGIQGTPTFLINGKLLKEAASFESFKKMIDEELQKPKGTVEAR
jgi:protein-disulfide isomerase